MNDHDLSDFLQRFLSLPSEDKQQVKEFVSFLVWKKSSMTKERSFDTEHLKEQPVDKEWLQALGLDDFQKATVIIPSVDEIDHAAKELEDFWKG